MPQKNRTHDELMRELEDCRSKVRELESVLDYWKAINPPCNSLLDALGSPIFYKNTEGIYLGCNKAFESFLQTPRDEIIGKKVHDLSPKELADTYREMDEQLFRDGGTQEYASQVQAADGSIRKVVFQKTLFKDHKGDISGLIGIVFDVTEQTETELELRKTANELETIFENSCALIVSLKKGRVFNRVNKEFEDVFGYSNEEIKGKSIELIHVNKNAFDQFGEKHFNKLSKGSPISAELPLKTRDGTIKWFNLYGKALVPEHLEEGVIWIGVEITERKKLEQLKEDVDRIMIHDLRSPVSHIINLPRIILMDKSLTPRQADLIRNIESSGQELLDRINLSLDLYKMEVGEYEYIPNIIDLAATCRKAISSLSSHPRSETVKTTLCINGQPADDSQTFQASANSLLIQNTLANLIQNALEGTEGSGEVCINLSETKEQTIISIINNTIVPEEIREIFFEKYSSSGKTGGTGLGTYSARLMVEAMKGSIAMQTGESGTEVAITLPRQLP